MKYAFVMDPLERIKPWKDTTYFLMLAAYQRGHQVCYFDQRSLWLKHDRACAQVRWVDIHVVDPGYTIGAQTESDLSEMDVVWIRTDPPFDRRYFYTTLLLDNLPATTRVVNCPSGIRNWNEKLAALYYPEFTPKTLVTNERDRIRDFSTSLFDSDSSGRVTIKPIDGFGGKGIVFYNAAGNSDENSDELLDVATQNGQHWVVVQEYLAAANYGDKRILLLNGDPLGAILRVHAEGVELNNLDAGGVAHPAELDAQDLKICAAMKPGLIEQDIFFAGIDIIGGMLIEVNVTSPTGLQELCGFHGKDYHNQIIAALE